MPRIHDMKYLCGCISRYGSVQVRASNLFKLGYLRAILLPPPFIYLQVFCHQYLTCRSQLEIHISGL